MKKIVIVATLCSLAAFASANIQASVYGGMSVGNASMDSDTKSVPTVPTFFDIPSSLSVDSGQFQGNDTAWSAFAGMTLTEHIGIEAGYWNHGTYDSKLTESDTGRIAVEEIYAGITLRFAFATRFVLVGGAGISRSSFDVHGSARVLIESDVEIPGLPVELPDAVDVPFVMPRDRSGSYWSAGLNIRLSPALEAGFSYGARNLGLRNVDVAAVSILYSL